jgi:hypothetical protein
MQQVIKDLRQSNRQRQLAQAMAQVFERTIRILLDDARIRVVVRPSDSSLSIAPAHSNLKTRTVTIDAAWLDGMDFAEQVRTAKGLLYHEASHLLWTPTRTLSGKDTYTAALTDWFMRTTAQSDRPGITCEGDVAEHLNVLEDKRIENLFVLRYPPARFYFAEPLYRLIVESDQPAPFIYLSVAGRPWLDHGVADAARKAAVDAVDPAWADDVDATVLEYLALSNRSMRADLGTVGNIILRWSNLVLRARDSLAKNPDKGQHGNGWPEQHTCSNPTHLENDSRRGTSSEQKLDELAGGSHVTGNTTQSDQRDDDKLTSESLEELAQHGATSEPESPGEAGESTPSEPTAGSGAGDAPASREESSDHESEDTTTSTLNDAADKALAEATSSIMDDVNDTKQSVGRLIGKAGTKPPSSKDSIWNTTLRTVESDMAATARQLATTLAQVRNEASPEWLKGECVGRLNVVRDLLSEDTGRMDVFDLWDNGTEDEMKVHVNLCIDLSSSMRGGYQSTPPYVSAAKAVWTLREAFIRVDHLVDVYGFSSDHQLLDERHLRTQYPVRKPSGGTAPREMLRDILLRSESLDYTKRLMIVLTDGSWSGIGNGGYARYQTILDAWHGIGGISHLFMIRSDEYDLFTGKIQMGELDSKTPYGFGAWTPLDTPSDMVPAVASIVKQLMLT